MGGGTMPIQMDLPWNQFKYPSSSTLPSASPCSTNFNLSPSANHSAPFGSSSPPPPPPPRSCCLAHQIPRTGDRLILGPVPSKLEVENAVSALEKFMQEASSSTQELISPCHVGGRVYDVFRLMRTQPSLKRVVVSLSSDKAVWDAIKNNEMVQKLCESPYPAEQGRKPEYSEMEADLVAKILNWILDIAKAKIVELVFKFQALVNEVFQHHDSKTWTDNSKEQVEDIVRSSLVLSMVILLIVVITRAQ